MNIEEKFRLWYREPIETLIAKDQHTGFAVLMLTLPILERYVRQKLKINQDNLPDQFYAELEKLFPGLKSRTNAKRFWRIYRHGLLHQATLQSVDGSIAFVHNSVEMLNSSIDGCTFGLSPNRFAVEVLTIIEKDLSIFENRSGPQPQLPTVSVSSMSSGVFEP